MRKSAFTLLEVLISIGVLASSIYVLSNLQIRSRMQVLKKAEEVERIFFVKKHLYQLFLAPPETDKPEKIEIEKPDIKIVSGKQSIDPKKSSLKDFSKEIDIIWTTGSWKREPDILSMKMISFVQKPKPKSKKDEKK